MSEPLWSDADIANDAKRASSNPTIQATIRSCLLFMRHGYEDDRAKTHATIAAQTQRIKELEAALAQIQERIANAYTHGYAVANGWTGKAVEDE